MHLDRHFGRVRLVPMSILSISSRTNFNLTSFSSIREYFNSNLLKFDFFLKPFLSLLPLMATSLSGCFRCSQVVIGLSFSWLKVFLIQLGTISRHSQSFSHFWSVRGARLGWTSVPKGGQEGAAHTSSGSRTSISPPPRRTPSSGQRC